MAELPKELETEVANRLRDPFETLFQGVIRTADPLLLERGDEGAAIYRDLLRDGKVFSALQKRVMALVGRPWIIEPVEDTAAGAAGAKTVTRVLKGFSFDQLCRDLLQALITGWSVSELIYRVQDGLIVPVRTAQRAPRRFRFMQTATDEMPTLRLLTRESMLVGIPVPDRKFIVHRVNADDDSPYGTGLGLQLFWPVFFKRAGIVAWNKFSDRFGTPTPWGKYPRNASAKEKGTLFDALKAFSNDGVVMTPEGTMIELLESKIGGTVTTQQSLVEYMDDWIDTVILGTEPRAKSGGALAAASDERRSVRLDLVQADADLLSDTLKSTLIRWICELNGLPPCLIYRDVSEEIDLKAEAETDKLVSEMGFELSEAAARAKYGEGWNKKAAMSTPLPTPTSTPTQFAEANAPLTGQQAIDAAVAAVPDAPLQAALQGLLEPLMAAIDQASSFEEALAAVEVAFPLMDGDALQQLLATAMFDAAVYGRQIEH